MSHKKRYHEVSEMVADMEDAHDFAKAFAKRLASRQLVKKLQIMRASCGLSQEDIASRLQCTQSRISKIENSADCDLRLGDILRYAGATGLQLQILLVKEDATIADEVKYHFFETKHLMEKLVALATKDETIAKGIAAFFGEACCNWISMLVDKVKSLPEDAREEIPFVKLMNEPIPECIEHKEKRNQNGKTNGAMVPA